MGANVAHGTTKSVTWAKGTAVAETNIVRFGFAQSANHEDFSIENVAVTITGASVHTVTHTPTLTAQDQAALVTTAKAAASIANSHFDNDNYARSETFYLRAFEISAQDLTASHFITKAILSRLNKVRQAQGKAPAMTLMPPASALLWTPPPCPARDMTLLLTPSTAPVIGPPTPAPLHATTPASPL
jgi:hypothetical protein